MMSVSAERWLLSDIRPTRQELRRSRRILHVKSLATLALAVVAYGVLVLADVGVPVRVFAGFALAQALVAIATGTMHDANHGAFSTRRNINGFVALTADLLGASSLLWRRQHNDVHHRHTNVDGLDGDIDQQPFARLTPSQQHRWFHAGQHIYLWPLYGFLAIKWFLFGDVRTLLAGRGSHVSRRDWCLVAAGKLLHASWAILVPLLFWSPLQVALVYLSISWVVGLHLAVLFQLAHCVDNAEFVARDVPHTRGRDVIVHQLATTVDFESRNPLARRYMRFLCGGLEYQVEHHLMPRVPHTFYPELARRLRVLCAEEGLCHRDHRSVVAALRAHHRHLRALAVCG